MSTIKEKLSKYLFGDLNGSYFYTSSSASSAFDDNDILKDFKEIPELNSVVNWKASAFRNAKIVLVNKKGDVIDDNPALFKSPNYFQGQGEFLRQTKLFHEIFGNEYLYFLSGINSKNYKRVNGIYTLPPNMVDVELKEKVPFWAVAEMPSIEYSVEWNGKKETLDNENIIHLNDNRVEYTVDNYIKGTSKIKSIKGALNNIRASYEARGTNLTEMGPRGIFSNDTKDGMGSVVPMDGAEKEKLHNGLKNYGAMKNQKRAIITNLALKWQPMGYSTDNLRAFEEATEDHHKICDAYGLTIDLFSTTDKSNYDNKQQAEKGAYQNTIIPEMGEWLNAINMYFELEDTKFVAQWDHLPVFQEDLESKSNAMLRAVNALDKAYASGAITIQEYQEELKIYMS